MDTNNQLQADGETAETHQYIIFQLNEDLFACDLLEISEVIEPVELKKVPKTNETFLGVFNLRGQILGVIDVRKHLNDNHVPESNAFVIVEIEGGKVALVIDKCVSVVGVSDSDVQKEEALRKDFASEYVSGYFFEDEKIVTILKINKLLEEFSIDPEALVEKSA